MHHRQLGKDGFSVSEIGLGCWQFGGDFGPITDATAEGIMRTAVECGVNFFDTANVYGDGHSEVLIGRFLRSLGPDARSIRVATKYGRGPDAFPDSYSLAGMRHAVTDSLLRLQVDKIDLLQLHCVPTEVLRDGHIFDWLRELRAEGLIEHFGASVESVEEGLICLEQAGLVSLQVIFNVLRQKPATELLPQAASRGVGIIVRLPLASGLLTGKFDAATTFTPTDHRHYNRDGQHFNVGETFAGLPFDVGVRLANRLKTICHEGSLAERSLRWILDHPAVSTIIPGASNPDQVRGNASASDLKPLSPEMHQRLAAFYHHEVAHFIRGPY
jgi:aryl-alcohol dehydrogenase-like predicted oxidoreductase